MVKMRKICWLRFLLCLMIWGMIVQDTSCRNFKIHGKKKEKPEESISNSQGPDKPEKIMPSAESRKKWTILKAIVNSKRSTSHSKKLTSPPEYSKKWHTTERKKVKSQGSTSDSHESDESNKATSPSEYEKSGFGTKNVKDRNSMENYDNRRDDSISPWINDYPMMPGLVDTVIHSQKDYQGPADDNPYHYSGPTCDWVSKVGCGSFSPHNANINFNVHIFCLITLCVLYIWNGRLTE